MTAVILSRAAPFNNPLSGAAYDAEILGGYRGSSAPSRLRKITDPNSAAYIDAVIAADGQPLEDVVQIAMDALIRGIKSDYGSLAPFSQLVLLAGPRTVSGLMVNLTGGTNPTNVGFVAGDYNRRTGLIGDATAKYINSNINHTVMVQNSQHMVTWNSSVHSTAAAGSCMGVGLTDAGSSHYGRNASLATTYFARSQNSTSNPLIGDATATGLSGLVRSTSTDLTFRSGGAEVTQASTSQAPLSGNIFVFGRNVAGAISAPSNSRKAMYSFGAAISLAPLEARVAAYLNALAAAGL